MNIPFFYYLFRRPGPFIERALDKIRTRLALPPGDAHSGLRSEGFYILALHFRRIPVGFEPLALDLNSGRQLEMRLTALRGFWEYAKKAARQAKALAACRKQELIIYFASDDIELRPTAREMLSPIGRVVFGLQDDEVGHVSTQWVDRHFSELEKEVKSKGIDVEDLDAVREKMEHSRDQQTYLGDMSMVTMLVLKLSFSIYHLVTGGVVDSRALALAHQQRLHLLLYVGRRYRLRSLRCLGETGPGARR